MYRKLIKKIPRSESIPGLIIVSRPVTMEMHGRISYLKSFIDSVLDVPRAYLYGNE